MPSQPRYYCVQCLSATVTLSASVMYPLALVIKCADQSLSFKEQQLQLDRFSYLKIASQQFPDPNLVEETEKYQLWRERTFTSKRRVEGHEVISTLVLIWTWIVLEKSEKWPTVLDFFIVGFSLFAAAKHFCVASTACVAVKWAA